jgi:hypothetical protein
MADRYGALELDVPLAAEGEAAGDPALTVIANYLKAVINACATTAWRQIAPELGKAGKDSPVNSVFTHDPEEAKFTEKSLPALYVFRSQGGITQDDGEDYRIVRSTVTCWWIYRPTTQNKTALRASFANAIAKVIDDAIDTGRHPAYVRDGDTDPRAPSYDADADSIKAAVASATTAQSYSGNDLDGVVGGEEMSPPRSPTVTLSGDASNFVVGSTVTWTGVNAIDEEVSVSVTLDGPGTYDAEYDLVQVTSIDVDAQAGTGGTLAFGTATRAGLGTDVYTAAGLFEISATRPTPKIINIGILSQDPRPYDAFEILLEVQEKFRVDYSQYAPIEDHDGAEGLGAGIDVILEQSDGDNIASHYLD